MAGFVKTSYIFLVLYCLRTVSEFVRQPEDERVDSGERAHFYCITNGNSIFWRVDGTNLDDLPSGTLKDEVVLGESNLNSEGDRLFTLSIPGRAIYNGTEVQCVADDGELSNVATLIVKGALTYATDVTVTRNGNSLTVLWVLPYPLNETGVKIWYQVILENVTDEDYPVTLNYPSCNFTTETSCTFPFNFLGLCERYAATVVPFSEAGRGNSSRGLLNSHPNCTSGQNDVDLNNDEETPPNQDQDKILVYYPSGAGVVVLLAILVCVSIVIGIGIRKWRKNKTELPLSVQELEMRPGDPPSAERESESTKDEDAGPEVMLVATNDTTTEKLEERDVVKEEETKPEMALIETHQIPSDIPTENEREPMGVAEGEDVREKNPQMTLKEPSYLPTEVAEEERITVDQENNSQRTIAGGVTEGGVEDSTPFESAQPVTNSSSKQGEGFVAGSHYVPVSNTERPLLVEREEETSAVTGVEEQIHEDSSTAMVAPTSDVNRMDKKTGECVADKTEPSTILLPKSSSRLQRKTSQDREHDKKEEQKEGMKSLLQAYQANNDADVLEGK